MTGPLDAASGPVLQASSLGLSVCSDGEWQHASSAESKANGSLSCGCGWSRRGRCLDGEDGEKVQATVLQAVLLLPPTPRPGQEREVA